MAEVKKVLKKKKSSVRKRAKQALARKKVHSAVKSKMRKVVKSAKTAAASKPEMLSNAYSEIDKAAKKGTIHKRTAARQKSRLAKSLIKK